MSNNQEVATVDTDPHRLAAFGILDILRRWVNIISHTPASYTTHRLHNFIWMSSRAR